MRRLRGRALRTLPWILGLLACSPASAQRLTTTVVPEREDLAFDVDLPMDYRDTAVPNGRLLWDTPGPRAGRHTLTFSETPKMSSYLVAMAVGDFRCLEGGSEGVPIRICATPDKTELGHIALDAAQRILTFYNGYYSIKYPFRKLDVVAVPDFAAGAMENTA